MTRSWRAAGAAIAFAGVLAGASLAQAEAGDLELASRVGADGPAGSGPSTDPSISADGCRIAFVSDAADLDPVDSGSQSDVFVRDLCAGETFQVSRADGTDSDEENDADGRSFAPEISADGTAVVFSSTARNIDRLDPDRTLDVYRRNLTTADTKLVSADLDHPNDKSAGGREATVSADGRYVSFVTGPGNHLESEGFESPDAGSYVVARDMDDPDATLSVASPAEGNSADPSISDDGAAIAFASDAEELVPGDDNDAADVFVRHCDAPGACFTDGSTELASRGGGATGAQADADSGDPELSGDGEVVAFESDATNLGASGGQIFVRDLGADATELVSRASGSSGAPAEPPAGDPSLSEDGSVVAFTAADSALAAGAPATASVFARDRDQNTTAIVSAPAPAAGAAGGAAVSADGIFIAFESAEPFGDGDTNSASDVFRREMSAPEAPPAEPQPKAKQLPIQSVRVNLRPVRGRVLVKRPGGRFERVEGSALIPVGSIVNVRKGEADLLAERAGIYESAAFFGGVFKVRQQQGADAPMEAKLTGKLNCGKRKGKVRAGSAGDQLAQAAGRRRGRRLWGRGKGRFRTRGRRGAGSVRGTTWFVADRCNGSTVMRVTEGSLAIDDFGKPGGLDKVIDAPGRYRAKPKD